MSTGSILMGTTMCRPFPSTISIRSRHLALALGTGWLVAPGLDCHQNKRRAGPPTEQACAIVRSPARQRGARYAMPPAGGASLAAGAEALLDNP